jgi:hypothetical protein
MAAIGALFAISSVKMGALWRGNGRPAVPRKWDGSLPFCVGLSRGAWLVRVDCGREGVGCLVVAAIHWSLCSQDVVVHRRRVTFHLMQPVLDHITDRYDSDQLPLVDHGDVAGSSLGHAFHDC